MDCQSHSSNMMVLLLLASSLAYFLYNKKVLPGMSMKPIILFFAARQKDHARSSVSELLLALKDPRSSLSESRNNTLKRKSQESGDVLSGEVPGKRISESGSRRNSRSGTRNSLQKKLVKCLKEGIRPGNLVCVPLWGMIINHMI